MTHTYSFELDDYARQQLEAHGIQIEDEIVREQPGLKKELVSAGEEGTKDVAAVITATGALAPLVVPIALAIIERLIPRTRQKEVIEHEEMIEELADGSTRHIVRIRTS
jgi:hypothetical protein